MKNKQISFKKNKNKYYQSFFDFIRTLYPYNQKTAIELYYKYIPKKFKPQVSPATTKNYVRLYKFFGFFKTEKIKILLNGK